MKEPYSWSVNLKFNKNPYFNIYPSVNLFLHSIFYWHLFPIYIYKNKINESRIHIFNNKEILQL